MFCGKHGYYICKSCILSLDTYSYNMKNIKVCYKYDGILRDTLIKFKFYDKHFLARGLSLLLLQNLNDINQYDIVTYVPISRKKMRERGYNQAYLLCKYFCKHFGAKPIRILKKLNSKTQSSLNRQERALNIKGKFILKRDIKGKSILVIDDVFTTGATTHEISSCLLNNGAKNVDFLILLKS